MFDDHFETPTVFETPTAAVAGFTDGDDDFPPPFAGDGLLAEIGLSLRAIRELRGYPPCADG